tara:strand:- start:620 stop:1711 length:1092 start_codon:yes stop_codon:yes gene_type:complete
MTKFIKTVSINFLIFFVLVVLFELTCGYWFDKYNFGPYMREYRLKSNPYTVEFDGTSYDYIYLRNYHGFRGEEIEPSQIQAIIIGGSTTDERYKPEKFTITEFLNTKLKKDNIDLKIINAGIEGQSTIGHKYNFTKWFTKLKDFSPKYIIFYIGINDTDVQLAPRVNIVGFPNIEDENHVNNADGKIVDSIKRYIIRDSIKSSSITYDLLRKIKHKYYVNEDKRILYDFDYSKKNKIKKDFKFLNYEEVLNYYNPDNILNKHKRRIGYYLNNVDSLHAHSKKIGAKPIFINQLTSDGNYNEVLFALNYSLIKHCSLKKYNCIDLAKNLKGKENYWYDTMHTTPLGSKTIAKLIYPELIKYLKN